jgi:hypothetical protein
MKERNNTCGAPFTAPTLVGPVKPKPKVRASCAKAALHVQRPGWDSYERRYGGLRGDFGGVNLRGKDTPTAARVKPGRSGGSRGLLPQTACLHPEH